MIINGVCCYSGIWTPWHQGTTMIFSFRGAFDIPFECFTYKKIMTTTNGKSTMNKYHLPKTKWCSAIYFAGITSFLLYAICSNASKLLHTFVTLFTISSFVQSSRWFLVFFEPFGRSSKGVIYLYDGFVLYGGYNINVMVKDKKIIRNTIITNSTVSVVICNNV